MPMINVRVSAEELKTVRRRARAAGQNISLYVRSSILPSAPAGEVRLVQDKRTGHLIAHAPKGTPPLTTDRVKELLADFP